MKPARKVIARLLFRLRRVLARLPRRTRPVATEPPLRARLLSAEQMERQGRVLAQAHRIAKRRAPDLLLDRLVDNRKVLERACDMLGEAVRARRRLTPAGEWLLDNIYLIEEQIRLAQRHLPKGYSRELPQILSGPSAGLPRVYDIALSAISHGDGRIDAESLSRFVAAYQSVAPLRLGELWAIPIMLRLALIENLRRVGARVIVDRLDRNLADEWADRLTEVAESDPRGLVLVIADMVRSHPPMKTSFVAELARRLQGQSAALALPLNWIELWLGDSGQSIERMVQAENQQQAADQVSISNSIASIRFLSTMDWREFVEGMSVVDRRLRGDPAGTYAFMDFATRDHYRHVVERLARRARVAEPEVADRVVRLAEACAAAEGGASVTAHVGYHLVDDGRPALERELGLPRDPFATLRGTARRFPLPAYLAPIAVVVATCTLGLMLDARATLDAQGLAVMVALLCVIAFSELGIGVVNLVATLLSTPRMLPRLDFSEGMPDSARTLVVVPTMFGDLRTIAALAESLEVRFLANRDANLHFALLTDFLDAAHETEPGDAALLDAAVAAIDALNRRHAPGRRDRFFLFHRPRTFNPREHCWMGYERKRGKLAAINGFLRGGATGAFLRIAGDATALVGVRYVITLDTDTRLPRDAARTLAGTLAHPLNRAVFDPRRACVVRGYGILQPRVGVSMSGRRPTWYARLFGSEPGIDPYTRAVSDVYQDLFAEGSFVGKGIYDVDAFEHALAGRFPENRILSHDLLEGCYARAGLVSDVQLYEDYPSRYAVDVKRRHRWIRGDWQLLPWLLPFVARQDGRFERNPLTMLARGKVLDNLRRSLVPAAMTALLVIGWLLSPAPVAWTAWVLAILLFPPLLASIASLLDKPVDMPVAAHLRQSATAAARHFAGAPLALACLPYEAWFSLDAIVRTLWRLVVSRRNLLQWSPSSEVERTLGSSPWAALRTMAVAPVLAAIVVLAVARANPGALAVAVPVAMLWVASPFLMWWLGRPRGRPTAELSEAQHAFLGRIARRTWTFFDTWVGPDDHWLPPDNVQEQPTLVVARRTSPTNIGLALLANLSACDFGYLMPGRAIARIGSTLRTLDALQRHEGHLYNWYDTETLAPLPPKYISTVDSGNLAAHLLTLRQGLIEWLHRPLLPARTLAGLADTLGVLAESPGASDQRDAIAAFDARLASGADAMRTIADAGRLLATLREMSAALEHSLGHAPEETREWAAALRAQCDAALDEIRPFSPAEPGAAATMPTLRELARSPAGAGEHARARIAELERLADLCAGFARMEFGFLYDRGRRLLAIGYSADERRLDPGYYDLLASEARLCTFLAIAQGQLPQDAWFALGRLLTQVDGAPALLSWSGSMFEYLMPQLVMPSYEGTLLDQTAKAVVERQIDYGRQRNVPWGISESGYNTVDARMNYQYRAFGVPGLGLQRGLAADLVIAPYASMLALMVAPEEACENLERLAAEGFLGRHGFYEAIDYTPARLPRGQRHAVVRSFMAHHQGMGLLSLSYLLHDQPMQKRFLADPAFQATLLLLQERVPRTGAFHPHTSEAEAAAPAIDAAESSLRVFRSADAVRPAVQVLSNGRYHVMLTSAGGGYSRLRDIALTRWREDATRDHWGAFCYLRDVATRDYWSTAVQPTGIEVDGYEAIFSDAKAEFRGRHRGFETHLEIAVSPEDDMELRRLRISNRGPAPATIEITTYAEVVLASSISDEMHPAFSNLFVQSELVPAKQAIICTRRPRSRDELPPSMVHLLAVHEADISAISYETDRARFVGRGNSLARPHALTGTDVLSGSEGSVLDPIVAIRCRLALAPEQTATVDMVTGIAATRELCAVLIDKYRDRHLADRVFDLAWTHSEVVRRQINATQADAQLYERLAGLVIYAHSAMRAEPGILVQNRRGQPGLWGHGISGDLPIVLLKIADAANIELVRQLVQAHAYWRIKGLAVDLVIWNEDQAGYRQHLQDQIMGLIAAGVEAQVIDRPGGIFVRPAQQITHEDRILLQSVARIVVSDALGTLAEQVRRRPPAETLPEPAMLAAHALRLGEAGSAWPAASDASVPRAPVPSSFDELARDLLLDNGHGGFSRDGREYLVRIAAGDNTPAPWSNVLANAHFGTVVSESACGYTWGENAHAFRLTPWHNDPVGDTSGEAIYLRDDDTGHCWSPTPLPRRGTGAYGTRHGFGYSVYSHVEDGISSELRLYVARDDAVKFSVLKLANHSGRERRVSVTGYVEWVLGDLSARTRMHVVTELDAESGAVTARNPYSVEFGQRVAFFAAEVDDAAISGVRSVTADRDEFLGRNGSMQAPAAMLREHLSGRHGAGLDPCAAIQVPLVLAPDASHEVVFRLGLGRDAEHAAALARAHAGLPVAHAALVQVREYWSHVLGAVQVETPDPAIDVLANGWLLYQTIGCRYLARSGYYQSGGAFGFRDQLQDTMAMVHAQPEVARAHLVLSAGHQFPQGDVQHWWHPPLDRGVRTHCSDDFLWLPFAACRYVEATHDARVLDEVVHYIEGRPVNLDEESYYDLPTRSPLRETVYRHCVRSIERALGLLGERGLPLIATGDWNDGMNRVGVGGRGESVWLGFFLYTTLERFGALAHARGDHAFATRCRSAAETLRANLDRHAWDGEWYRRAWFDNGTPLGSAASGECMIDSIAQSWSVLSGAGDPARAAQAMASLDRHLVRRDAGLVQLLQPPFDHTEQDPGYIRGYVPGVRENGGQYTHAAIWATMAFAALGDRERAWELMRMINPVNHALDAAGVATYKVEPYVVAADVYAVAPHVGRGGWTWYTGSAGWMYRLIVESLLGLDLEGDVLRLAPCIPADWPGYKVTYRWRDTTYRIEVRQVGTGGTPALSLDGVAQEGLAIPLRQDRGEHFVEVVLGGG